MRETLKSPDRSGESGSGALAEQLKNGPLPFVTALRYTVDIATALCDLHDAGSVHGGVRPSNIALWGAGVTLRPAQRNVFSSFTSAGDIAGLGATLYEMLTGRPPDCSIPRRPESSTAGASMLEKLSAAALNLAGRCMAADSIHSPDIHRIRIEARVLLLVARQRKAPEFISAPAPTPAADSTPDPAPGLTVPQPVPSSASSAASPTAPLPEKRPRLDLQEFDMPCPRCHVWRVFSSRPRTRFEKALQRSGFPICRCHNCGYRFLYMAGLHFGKSNFSS